MSRRWYRHGGNMVFVGWDRSAQKFLLTVAEMCTRCGGFGEEPDTDNFCFACGGEGVRFGSNSVTQLGLTAGLDEVAQELSRLEIPFPAEVRTDLEQDRAINAGEILHDYGQASQPSNS
jgi:hypothetical protein